MKLGFINFTDYGLAFSLLCQEQGHEIILFHEDSSLIQELKLGIYRTKQFDIQNKLSFSKEIEISKTLDDLIKSSDIFFSFDNFNYVFSNLTRISSEENLYDKNFVLFNSDENEDITSIENKINSLGQISPSLLIVSSDNFLASIS